MTREQIEKKYGVAIRDDSFWNPMNGRYVKQYKIYSADGCRWETGFKNIKEVEAECKRWSNALLEIKANVEKAKKEIAEEKLITDTAERLVRKDVGWRRAVEIIKDAYFSIHPEMNNREYERFHHNVSMLVWKMTWGE